MVGPHWDDASRIEREQGAKVAAPRIVQVEAVADLRCQASVHDSIRRNANNAAAATCPVPLAKGAHDTQTHVLLIAIPLCTWLQIYTLRQGKRAHAGTCAHLQAARGPACAAGTHPAASLTGAHSPRCACGST